MVDFTVIKTLTENDLGVTGSHQAGFHVPKALAPELPELDERRSNPDAHIEVESPIGNYLWRYIHYNNKLHSDGTRDEFRVTRCRAFLRAAGAEVGDELEIAVDSDRRHRWRVRLNPFEYANMPPDVVRLDRAGHWVRVV